MDSKAAFRPTFLAILIFAPLLLGCQRMVEKEKMEEVGNWAISICKCSEMDSASEAQKCASALNRPQIDLLNSSGRPQYKLDSVHTYTEIESKGVECQMKISVRQ